MLFPDSRILLFAKAPVAGLVKTRLIPAIGEQQAANLYAELLSGVINRMSSGIAPLQLWCSPTTEHSLFQAAARSRHISLHIQRAGDLGQRMSFAAQTALNEGRGVILVGGDCPLLEAKHIQKALIWLEEGMDAVLGPAEDGGYVLLALKRMSALLFDDIPWGSAEVSAITRQRLQILGWSWRELEPLWDVDREADLLRYQRLSAGL